MKKLLSKVRRTKQPESTRITNDTLAEHRQKILAGGRKYKYPLQYARHKLVFNTIIISVAVLIIAAAVGWWQLYLVQNTSDFIYRIAKVLQLPVAYVDGQPVLYSDYLMKYQSSIHYLVQKEQVNISSTDGQRQVAYIKQQSLDDAIADAYATKLANQLHISVSNQELQSFLKLQRQSSDGQVSTQTYNAVVLDYYGWTPDQYESATRIQLLRQKVTYAVDTSATEEEKAIGTQLKASNPDFKAIATASSGAAVYGASGWVPRSNQDGGLAIAAAKLQKSAISSVIKTTTGDGYYYVRLLDSNDTQVNYEYLHIPLTTFDAKLAAVKKSHQVDLLINVPGA